MKVALPLVGARQPLMSTSFSCCWEATREENMMMKAAAKNRARRNLIALCGHVVYSDLSRILWCCVCTGISMCVVSVVPYHIT